VFSAPVRGVLHAQSQREASALHREIDGRGFGAQAFGILPKIREWDELLRADATARSQVCEVHPEVSFAAMNGGVGIVAAKRTAEGHAQRRQLLCATFDAAAVDALFASIPNGFAAADDVADALAALWSAERIVRGESGSLPSPAAVDSAGLGMAIWY
jgi:predicted RNase H-like nuclease